MSAILGTAAVLIRGDTHALGGDLSKAKGIIGSGLAALSGPLAAALGGLAALGAGAIGVGSAISTAMGTIAERVEGFKEAAMLGSRMGAVLKATGGAAGFTADEMRRMADEIQSTTTHEGDAVLGLQAKLMTFKKVSGDVFREALGLSLDLADSGFGSAESAVVQMGKALEDPVRGMAALRRSGVSFTEEEKAKIKSLTKSNQLLKAQEIILAAVKGQVGGVAAALAKTDAGRSMQLGNILGDAKEKLGEIFLPIMNKITEMKIAVTRAFAGIVEVIRPLLTKAIGYVGDFVIEAAEWFQAVVENYRLVWSKLPAITKAVGMSILDVWIFMREAIPQYLGMGLKAAFGLWVDWTQAVIKAQWQLILGIGRAFKEMPGVIKDALLGGEGLKGISDGMGRIVDTVVGPIRGLFKGLGGKAPDWTKVFREDTKAEWRRLGMELDAIVKRKKELEALRKGDPAPAVGGKPGRGGVAGVIEERIRIDWGELRGFQSFEGLGRKVQEMLISPDDADERTADGVERVGVGVDKMGKGIDELVRLNKRKEDVGGLA